MLKRFGTLIPIFMLMIFGLNSCFDAPGDFVAPRWDVNITAPITEKSYTIQEAIEKDTSIIRWYTDPGREGLLYYSDVQPISAIKIADNLNVAGFSTHASQKIGSIKINNVDPIITGILLEDWTSLTSGSQAIFPENENAVSISFPEISAFQSVTLESGTLNIKIRNKLPVITELRGIIIKNADDNSVVAQKPASEKITIPPNDSASVIFDLAGKKIKNALKYDGTLYSPGSGGNIVTLPSEAGTELEVSFENLSVSETVAPLPEQDPFTKDGNVAIDDSTYIEKAVFGSGSFEIVFNNHLDVDISLRLEIKNLKRPNGSSFVETISLSRSEANKSISEPDIKGWSIATQTPGTPTNELEYSAVISTLPSNDARVLSKEDSIGIDINFGSLSFAEIEGKIKPTSFNIEPTTFSMDLGDLSETFKYDDINFKSTNIDLVLNSSADIEFELSAKLRASNGIIERSIEMNNILITSSPPATIINLSDYGLNDMMNSFDSALPNEFFFEGGVIVNPNYKVSSISQSDSISGQTEIEFPLNVGIGGGSFRDTVDIDISKDNEKDIEKINFAAVTVELTNKIPVNITFTGEVLDSLGNILLILPPTHNDVTEIKVPAPTVDQNGNVVSAGTVTQTIKLYSDDVKKLLGNKRLVLVFSLDTAPVSNTNPVKFKITDTIQARITAEASYLVDLEEGRG
ncbi:MAG: hypothetical protein ABIJ40_10385 [Bacteroidota bacterium]